MNTIVPVFTGGLGSLFGAIAAVFASAQFQAIVGVLLGFVGVVFLAFLASLIGWGIVVLMSPAVNEYNPNGPPADKALDAEKVGVLSFFSVAALGDAFVNLFSSIGSVAMSAVQFIGSNLVYLVPIALLFAFILVWNAWQHRIIEAFANFESNFFLGFWRSTAVPLSSVIAFVGTQLVVLLDGVRHFVQAGTVITIERSLICGFSELQTVSIETGDLFREVIIDTENYLIANGTSTALTRGPNYFPTGAQLGNLIASTRTFADCACQPLSDRLFVPLSVPFTQPAFANFINNTLGIVPAFLTQLIFRPIAVAVERARADPTANLTVDIVPPSLNASLDSLAFAVTNLTLFFDSFVPALDNTTTLFLEDLLGIPLPSVLPPQAGLLTASVGGLVDITIQIVKDFLNLVVNAIFDSEQVFGSEGFLFFRLDDAVEAFKRAVRIVEGYLTFFSTYLRQLGAIVLTVERKRDVLTAMRGFEYLPQATIGALLQEGFDLFASFFDVINCYIDGLFIQFFPPLAQLIIDLPVGTIYRTVRAVSLTGLPDIFAFAQELWGDTTPVTLECNNLAATTAPLFRGTVEGCLEVQRFTLLCVNAGLDSNLRSDIANFTIEGGFDLFESLCLTPAKLGTCPQGALAVNPTIHNPPIVNRFADVLNALSNTSACTTSFFNDLCTQCGIFGIFLGQPLVNVVVQAVLLPLNIFIHLDEVVTTEYLGTCVDFAPLLDALQVFTDGIATSIETFSTGLTGVPCPIQSTTNTTVNVGSATFLCAVAGVERFTFRTIWDVAEQVTIAFRAIVIGIAAAAGAVPTREFTDIFDQLSFTQALADAHVAIVDIVAVALSILIPSSIPCADMSGLNLRTAFVQAFGNLAADLVLVLPNIVFGVISTIITGIETGISGATTTGSVIDTVTRVFIAIIAPLLHVIGDGFIEFGVVLDCLTAADAIADIFTTIGNFLTGTAILDAITVVVNILIDLIALVVGILQAIITGDTTILSDALELLEQIIANIIIAIFGLGAACEVQAALCVVTKSGQVLTSQCVAAHQPVGTCLLGSTVLDCTLDAVNCANPFFILIGKGCPSSPYGCCGLNQFPVNGSATGLTTIGAFPPVGSFPEINLGTGSCDVGQFCDVRVTCGWNLPTQPDSDIAAIPFTAIAPTGDPDAALGQSTRSIGADCPRFVNLTNCVNPGLVNSAGQPFSHGEIARARPFGLRYAAHGKRDNATGAPLELLSPEHCERIIDAYGETKLQAAIAPLAMRHPRYIQRAVDNLKSLMHREPAAREALHCYIGLHPELQPQADTTYAFAALRGKKTVTDGAPTSATPAHASMSTRFIASVLSVRDDALEIYEDNRRKMRDGVRRPMRVRASAHQRYAQYSVRALRLTPRILAIKQTTANWLATMRLSDVRVERESARVLVNGFFNSFHAEQELRKQRRRDVKRDGSNGAIANVLAHGAALVMHLADAVEHVGYAAHYHLNLRPADVTLFGVGVAEQRRLHVNSRTSARPLVHIGERLPHPLSVLHAWAMERRAYAAARIHDKLRSFLTSEHYSPQPEAHALKLSNLRIQHRPSPNAVLARSRGRRKILSMRSRAESADHYAQRSRFAITAVLPNDTALSDILGLQQCSLSEQVICTNCALLDNLVFAVEQQVNATIAYYNGAEPRGFPELVDQFETTFHNTLIDPVGPDTYTTANPRTPFILREFLNIDWPWQWDYSEFRSILFANNTAAETNDTNAENAAVGYAQRSDAAIAASQNRTDLDLVALNATSVFIQPIVNFLERVVFEVTQVGSLATIERLFERYVVCDYTRGLMGNDPHSTGLFSALVITVLGLFVVGVFISLIPGAGMCIMMIYSMFGLLIFFPLVWWIGYNASPLCTLPSFFGGIPGVPVPFLADAQRLFEELTPECPPINPAMIDPAYFAQASTMLCGVPGNVPPLIPCSQAAGFIDGLDNVFFMLTSLYGEGASLAAAAELAPIAPDVAAVASIYTDAHVQALANNYEIGALCNFLTIGNVLVLALVLGALAIAGAVSFAVILFFIGLLLIAIALGVYTDFIIWLQVQQSFLNSKRRFGDKMKTE